jgi:hypothetical protein
MRRRSGQSGTITRKGNQWHVRFYVDMPEGRKRKSEPVGPAAGKGRLTKAEAGRRGAELIDKLGVNTEAHLERAQHPENVETFRQRVVVQAVPPSVDRVEVEHAGLDGVRA